MTTLTLEPLLLLTNDDNPVSPGVQFGVATSRRYGMRLLLLVLLRVPRMPQTLLYLRPLTTTLRLLPLLLTLALLIVTARTTARARAVRPATTTTCLATFLHKIGLLHLRVTTTTLINTRLTTTTLTLASRNTHLATATTIALRLLPAMTASDTMMLPTQAALLATAMATCLRAAVMATTTTTTTLVTTHRIRLVTTARLLETICDFMIDDTLRLHLLVDPAVLVALIRLGRLAIVRITRA